MPYSDAILLSNEFEQNGPPIRMLFAQFAGYKPPERFSHKPFTADDFMMTQKIMGPVSSEMPAELKDAIRWAEGLKKKHPALLQ